MLTKISLLQRARLQVFSSTPTSSVADPDAYSLESDSSSFVDPETLSKPEYRGVQEVCSQCQISFYSEHSCTQLENLLQKWGPRLLNKMNC